MKVLKPGTGQKGWSKKFTCTGDGNGDGGCGAVLLVKQGDVYETCSSALGEVDHHATFQCAECGVETDIPYREIRFGLPSKSKWMKSKGLPT